MEFVYKDHFLLATGHSR